MVPALLLLLAYVALTEAAVKVWINSDASHRNSGMTDKDDVVCFGLLTAYVERGGKALSV